MCGVAGYLNFNNKPIEKQILVNMCKILKHRGPDGYDFFQGEELGLSHTRLSIIDLTNNANQPMISEDGRYVISYNGEVFNFKEIRKDLISFGYNFKSNSDTEVVLYSLIHWGTESLNKFNGQFALAFWDKKDKTLLLARDRYGIKPIYFFRNNNTFVFSSEIKALFCNPEVKIETNKQGLLEYLTFQNFLLSETLFKNINILKPGSFLFINSNNCINQQTYWDFNFEEPINRTKSINYFIEKCDFLLNQAIKRQLVSDVEIGSYLSGGMDSGTITALASKNLKNLRSFTCGFDLNSASGIEMGMDERENAELMSYLFKTEHYEVILKAGDMERVMQKLVWHIEEPRVGQSYPNFYVSQLASKFCKVVLSGDGGDELFGGYPWRYYRAINNSKFDDYINKYYNFWQRLIPSNFYHNLFYPIWNEVSDFDPMEIFTSIFKKEKSYLSKSEDYVNHSLYFETKTFLHGLLTVEDKISMSNSLETRVPFLDNDLVDFAMEIPVSLKLGNLDKVKKINENETLSRYLEQNKDGKILLRKVMEKYIPSKITKGIKKGFSAPDASWFKGESIEYVKDKLLSKNSEIYNYLDYNTTRQLVDQHLKGKHNRRLLIWSLLSLETWFNITKEDGWKIV